MSIWPHGHCHRFGFLQGPVLIPVMTSASCLLFGLLVGFFISVAYVVSSPLLILLLLDFGSTCNVFFPFYLHSGPGEYIFHGFALVVGEFFLYVTIRKYASFEGGDCGGGVTSGDGYFLLAKACYISTQGLSSMLEDLIEVVGRLLKASAAGEFLYEFVGQDRKGAY